MTKYQGERIKTYRSGHPTDTQLASLYRLYEFFVVGWTTQARRELEYHWRQTKWPISEIPEIQDDDTTRLGILVALIRIMCEDFNTLVRRGYTRGKSLDDPADSQSEGDGVLLVEKLPEWVQNFGRVTQHEDEWIHMPDALGHANVGEPGLSEQFQSVGIIVREPRFRLA